MSHTEEFDQRNRETVDDAARSTDARTRTGGAWLAVGSLLLVVSLAFHPPLPPELGEFMATIAEQPERWAVVHWGAALALVFLAMTGLILLSAGAPVAQNWRTISAWSALVVGALWVTSTAVAEATVITEAAVAGDTATFEAWTHFAEGRAAGFGLLALSFAVVAADEARSARSVTPTWAAWVGALAAVGAFVGFVVLGLLLGVAAGGPVWLVSSVVMGLWAVWFGVGLARSGDAALLGDVGATESGERPVG